MSTTCQRSPDYCLLPNGHDGLCFGKQRWGDEPSEPAPIGQDGKPLRLCSDRACSFYLRHVENCPSCLGWGTTKERSGREAHRFDRFPPLAGESLDDALATGDWLRCVTCGGTPSGIVENEPA